MKKILLLFLFVISANSYSQCTLLLDDLKTSVNLPYSEIKNFAQNNGYTYNEEFGVYVCTSPYLSEPSILQINQNNDGKRLVVHNFTKKSIFTQYKTLLENFGEYFSSDSNGNTFTQIYYYKKSIISLTTENQTEVKYKITILAN